MLNIKIKDLLMTLELCLKVVVCNSREETVYIGTVEDLYMNRSILGNRTVHKLIPGARGIKLITEE